MMKKTAESFSSLCISAYEYWQMYKIMYEYVHKYKITVKDNSGIWSKFGPILRHHLVLQITKIHDPEKYRNYYNFSLAYFVKCVNTASYNSLYHNFLNDNREFIEAIDEARKKVVAHRDLEVFNSPDGVGAFSDGLDNKYFDSLHELISEGYKELGLGDFPEWPQFIIGDTKAFMDKILKAFST